MKRRSLYLLAAVVLLAIVGCTGFPDASPTLAPPSDPGPQPTLAALAPSSTPANPSPASPADPFAFLSQEHLLAYIADLAAIQPYSGWRNSASQGEAEGLDYVAGQLSKMEYLDSLGLELERQTFHVFLGMDLW